MLQIHETAFPNQLERKAPPIAAHVASRSDISLNTEAVGVPLMQYTHIYIYEMSRYIFTRIVRRSMMNISCGSIVHTRYLYGNSLSIAHNTL